MAKKRATVNALSRRQHVNLMVGRNCGGVGPGWAFETEDERRAAWDDHGNDLLAASRPGRRPAAWWDYGGYEKLPYETDLQALDRLNLLTEHEVEYLANRRLLPVEPATGKDPREMFKAKGRANV